jgi:hypothetical protein
MNTRGKVQLISGLILDCFRKNKIPLWKEIESEFVDFGIVKLTGLETLPNDFLKKLFKNSQDILDKLEFFKEHHHYLTILLLKDEYSLDSCVECGHLSRKISIGMEDPIVRNDSEWILNY